ncbi:MAG: 4Fe-4S binding protein [Bacteroidales bacterium]|nr:4Fe-4S binding protein [Bacteroidales bacterium]
MNILQKIGLALFTIALLIFLLANGLDSYRLSPENLSVKNEFHKKEILGAAQQLGMMEKTYGSSFAFNGDLKKAMHTAQQVLDEKAKQGLPEGVSEWDYRLGDWAMKDYALQTTKLSATGPVADNPLLFLLLTFGLGILGGLLYIVPKFGELPGIKNNGIYHNPMTRGLKVGLRGAFLGATILGVLVFGMFYLGGGWLWSLLTVIVGSFIAWRVLIKEKSKEEKPARSASPGITGWLGVLTGVLLIGFYVALYWAPQHITAWMHIVDPVSKMLSGNEASQWFLYGLLYTIVVMVMGIRMIAKYRHNKYQIIRTFSVMFFQTAIAFLLPEILVRLNQPYYDFKNIWPLNYSFFFDYNLDNLINSGGLGIFMLVWGIVLIVIGVPVITYFFGKRWYCSWVCGCGGLAETLGDPYRQLSDKSLRAWQYERWIIHAVLAFAVVMTLMVLYTYFTGSHNVLFISSDTVRAWYGFLISSAFAGVVGTGFYPLMGNRVWCRFGCPLAAYLGLVQKFKSRFRITVNGGQCISCGNCSTYCEMGIDVRAYAQRGQDIVRSSCVGCGVCSAVCPRGVLRLENNASDVQERANDLRVIHVKNGELEIENS